MNDVLNVTSSTTFTKKVEIYFFSENKIEFYTFLKIFKFENFYHFEIL